MTDFFTRLAEQALGRTPVVHPRVAPRFAPGRPLVGETLSDFSEEAETHAEGLHAFSERETLTYSSSPGPTIPRPQTMHRFPHDNGLLLNHRVGSDSKKEDRGSVSSSSQDAASAPRPDEPARTTLDSTSVRRRRAGSDRREPIETVPHENGISSKKLETFAPITSVVRSEDLLSREHSTEDFPSLSKSSMAEIHRRSSLREARDQIPSSELPSPPPTVRVTIGRVEVKAIMPPAQPTRAKPARSAPTLSLEDYLKQRNGGKR
jgi:hypothetical protein